MIWNVASLITALFGGVVAVFIGQILKTYREDIDAARRLRSQLKYLKSLRSNDSEREHSNHGEIQKARNGAEEIYRENFWLLTDDGQKALYNIFYQTDAILKERRMIRLIRWNG
ncbi:hypothetical protein EKH57_02110 [Halorubrum sp. BOL3-1]|uniref:hypothetical protein n=1 Tax=Halorubrum sp. BOL3-1 TaxID=2497325 RepID=UPI001005118D|nr:hypothetical protein [Halorubrum sp. BOL3-1]QAU11654.1 hypothetical protein EKH57_02110 [Halorubrum sp. BOL3-1]